MFDYNRGFADNLEASGIMSINRLPKFGYYFFQSQRGATEVSSSYASGPMTFIASYWNERSDLNVRVFSNCEEVELSLNGEVIARQVPDTNRMSINLAHPPFTFKIKEFKPGTLTAIGYIHGGNVIRYSVSTPGNPVAVRLSYDESGCPPKANVNDILFIYAHLEDENGTVVPVNGVKVDFKITGDAELINPDYTDSEAGIATALVRICEAPGEISVLAVCKNLLPGNLKIPVVK
jgi:beta-galactosidase